MDQERHNLLYTLTGTLASVLSKDRQCGRQEWKGETPQEAVALPQGRDDGGLDREGAEKLVGRGRHLWMF